MDQKNLSTEFPYHYTNRYTNHQLDIVDDVSGELDALEQELNDALHPAQPLTFSNPKHVARIVFEILAVRPRATDGVTPPTKPSDDIVPWDGYGGPLTSSRPGKVRPRNIARVQARRNNRRELTRRSLHFPLYQRRSLPIDFDAELPQLPFVDATPSELPLEQLVFYRDEHPLIGKLCRYQALWRRRLTFVTSERYQ